MGIFSLRIPNRNFSISGATLLPWCYRMFKPILGDLNFKLFAVRIVFWLVLWGNKNMRLWWENKINRIFFEKLWDRIFPKKFETIMKIFNKLIFFCDAHKKSSWVQNLVGNWGLVGNLGAKFASIAGGLARCRERFGNRNWRSLQLDCVTFSSTKIFEKSVRNFLVADTIPVPEKSPEFSSTGIFVSAMSAKQL